MYRARANPTAASCRLWRVEGDMRRVISVGLGVAALLSVATLAWADFSPHTSSPDVADIPAGQTSCHKADGYLMCRWGGDCVQKGNQCYSCIEGYHWSEELGSCYSCGQGQSLQKAENGQMVCR